MKTLIWKIRYTLEIRRLLGVSLHIGWDMAGSTVESYLGELDDYSPKAAAEDERDAWEASI